MTEGKKGEKTVQTAKDEEKKRNFLERYQKLNQEINWNLERLAQWKSFSQKVTASYSAVGTGGAGPADRVQFSYDKIEALAGQINTDIDRLVDLRLSIEKTLSGLPDTTYRILLWQRYIMGETWEKIAEELNYCSKQVMRLHLKALQSLELPTDLLS